MARARNIKPGLYENEDLAECSIWARYIFPGLWCLADREGRLEDRPKRIKAKLLPFDDGNIDELLNELQAHKFLVRYQNDGGSFIQISKFSKHQSPHYSEKPSTIKPPEFQESSDDDDGSAPGKVAEQNESEAHIKKGSQPPDSLIHRFTDSPNPENTKPRQARHRLNGEKFELPSWVPIDQWEAWIEARTKKRNAPTNWAKSLAVAKLEELREQGHHPSAVLAQSAFHGWAGLFPVKANN